MARWNNPNCGFQKGHINFRKKGYKHSKKTKIKIGKIMRRIFNLNPNFQTGEKNHRWKGGKTIHGCGYILIKNRNHPFSTKNGYIFEHRLAVEKQIGRYLKPKEVVHHRGIKYPISNIKNKQDNRPENLMAFINEPTHKRFEQEKPIKPEEIIFDGRKISIW